MAKQNTPQGTITQPNYSDNIPQGESTIAPTPPPTEPWIDNTANDFITDTAETIVFTST